MSSPSEVLIRILALLQRKTLLETKNRTLKCLKRHYSTVQSMKNVALLTEDGALGLFFRSHPGGFDSSRVPIHENLPSRAKKNANARGSALGGGGGGGRKGAGCRWNCLTHYLSLWVFHIVVILLVLFLFRLSWTSFSHICLIKFRPSRYLKRKTFAINYLSFFFF